MKKITGLALAMLLFLGQAYGQKSDLNSKNNMDATHAYTFQLSDQVIRQKVTFKGDLYFPKNAENGKLPTLAISGPFGAVKEQSSGLYANQMAERGFI